MRHKRVAAAEARETKQKRGARSEDRDVVPWLRALGFNAAEARRASERCEDMPDATMEERVRTALTCFRPRGARVEGCATVVATRLDR